MTSAARGAQRVATAAVVSGYAAMQHDLRSIPRTMGVSNHAAVQHDLGVLLITSLLPLGLVLLTEVLKDKNKLSTSSSRKFLHIVTGPLFVLTWALYTTSPAARYLAALLPGLMALRFALAGLGVTREPRLVAGTARSGQPSELLRGPLQYGLVHVVLTAACWRSSPAGIMGVAALCAGDGLADVAGRRWGTGSLPHNKTKTWVGSGACVLGSWCVGVALLLFMRWQGFMLLEDTLQHILEGALLASLAAAAAESLPLRDADNLLVPAAAAGVTLAWFQAVG